MVTSKTAKKNKVGETSSKYGYPGGDNQFISDLKAHEERHQQLWSEFVCFMKSHNATPEEFRTMFSRYYEEFIKTQ